MEKNSINYSIKNFEEIRNKFIENNNLIKDTLKILEKEYSNMSDILNTPNSNKIVPELYKRMKDYDEMVNSKGMYFDKVFTTVINEYNEFIINTKNSIGGNIYE